MRRNLKSALRRASLILCVAFVLGALCVVGCGRTMKLQSNPPRDAVNGRDVVLFVPGYKGSVLTRAGGRVVWVSAATAVFSRASLVLDTGELGFSQYRPLEVGGVLDRVPVVPWLYSVSIYDAWIERLTGRALVVPFAYDWRGDNVEAIAKLDATIRELRGEGAKTITIVAHSMGAMVTSYYLRYGTQAPETAVESWAGTNVVDGAVLITSPFRGSALILHDMQFGIKTGFNRSLLEADAVASFPSSHELFPHPDDVRIVDPELGRKQIDMFDPVTWERNRWGIFGSATPETLDARRAYVARYLARGKAWLERISAPLGVRPRRSIPVLNIVGRGYLTQTGVIWSGGRDLHGDVDRLPEEVRARAVHVLYSDGDQTVPVSSATLPTAYREALDTEERGVAIDHGSALLHSEASVAVHKMLNRVSDTFVPPSEIRAEQEEKGVLDALPETVETS